MNKILLNQILHTLILHTLNLKNDNLNENEQIIAETPPNSNELDIKLVLRRSE